ncbi:MAG: hypothetical protein MJ252_01450 [archaeon]|nr:hypothetical protein [archaeon]
MRTPTSFRNGTFNPISSRTFRDKYEEIFSEIDKVDTIQNTKWNNYKDNVYYNRQRVLGVLGVKSIQQRMDMEKKEALSQNKLIYSTILNDRSKSPEYFRTSSGFNSPSKSKNNKNKYINTNFEKKQNLLNLLEEETNSSQKKNKSKINNNERKVYYIFNEIRYPDDVVSKLKKKFPDYNNYFRKVYLNKRDNDSPRITKMKKEIDNLFI